MFFLKKLLKFYHDCIFQEIERIKLYLLILKRAVSLFLATLIWVHHVILLSYPISDKVIELSEHYQLHLQKNPALSIFEWINMHFNPVSKHLFANSEHSKPPETHKNVSLYFFRETLDQSDFFNLLKVKKNILEAAGKYKFLFVQEFLIPPKC
jgi:hypothetical protein